MLRRRLMMAAMRGGKRYLKWIKRIVLGHGSRVTTGPGTDLDLKGKVESEHTHDLGAWPASDLKTKSPVTVGSKPTLTAYVVSMLSANSRAMVSHAAGMVAYLISELHMFVQIVTGHLSAISTGTGTLLRRVMQIRTTYSAALDASGTVSMSGQQDLTSASAVDLDSVAATDVGALTVIQAHMGAQTSTGTAAVLGADCTGGINHAAKMVFWCEPVFLEDGTLYIRQAYAAGMNGDTLEVS